MPAPLPATPWLQGPDVGRQFLGGAQIGVEQARIGQEQQRLQIQAQQAEQQRMQEEQRLAIAHQYQQQQIGLQQQQLKQAQQLNQVKIQQAGRMAQARMQFNAAVSGGMNPQEAFAKFGPDMVPSMAGMGTFYSQMARQQQPFAPGQAVDVGGGAKVFQSAPGRYTQLREPAAGKTPPVPQSTIGLREAYTAGLKAAQTSLEAAQASRKQKDIDAAQSTVNAYEDKIKNLDAAKGKETTHVIPVIDPETGNYVLPPGYKGRGAPSGQDWTGGSMVTPHPGGGFTPQLPGTGQFGPTMPLPTPRTAPADTGAPLPTPRAAPPSAAGGKIPSAPKNEKDRVPGQVYNIDEGPLKGHTMKWTVVAGQGEWEQLPNAADQWIKSNVAAPVGSVIGKAYHGLTSGWTQ